MSPYRKSPLSAAAGGARPPFRARSADEVKRLGQALCDLSSGGKVPVYLAAPPPPSTGINPGLLACAKPASAQMDVDRGVSGVLTYDRGAGQGANFMPTPAFALA